MKRLEEHTPSLRTASTGATTCGLVAKSSTNKVNKFTVFGFADSKRMAETQPDPGRRRGRVHAKRLSNRLYLVDAPELALNYQAPDTGSGT